jgi:hypothetical protein
MYIGESFRGPEGGRKLLQHFNRWLPPGSFSLLSEKSIATRDFPNFLISASTGLRSN